MLATLLLTTFAAASPGDPAAVAPPLALTFGGRRPAAPASLLTWGKADPWITLGIVGVLVPASLLYPDPDPTGLAPGTLHPGDTWTDGPFRMTLRVSEPWKDVSDVLGYSTGFGVAAVFVPYELHGDGWVARDLGRAGIALQATASTLAFTTVLKKIAARPRPFTAVDPADFGELGSVGAKALEEYGAFGADGTWTYTKPDAIYSWPSGHTSGVASGTFAVTTIALYSMTDRRAVDYLWYLVPTALTATTGYARVRATMHAPTDVISGGLLGAACGILIPLAHVRRSDGIAHVGINSDARVGINSDGVYVAGAW